MTIMSTFRNRYEDDEIIDALQLTPPEQRRGNLWTFYENLPRPERDRLAHEAEMRGVAPPREAGDPG